MERRSYQRRRYSHEFSLTAYMRSKCSMDTLM
ncbi:hypothetical protein MEBOL_004095 [Melittangium boletus DSM 14713]|uniref:Uncharacterized protein n=1 Tax=Melittangium boletus DSM 14713 TaxID=1294270 RepID=A0A250IFN7_9BACT|nr:hypothetical protein MEBOL_004095 [Melittangium boletus DSM 14713]